MISPKLSSKNKKIEIVALLLIIIDIVFFPVSPFYSMPYSSPLIVFFAVKNLNSRAFNKSYFVSLFAFILIVATMFSFIGKESVALIDNGISVFQVSVQREDVKRLVYLLFGIALYKSVFNLYDKHHLFTYLKIKRVLLFVCFCFVVFGFIFSLDINLFYLVKSVFFNADVNMTTSIVLRNAGYLSRFNFILLDPNNASYFILIIIIFLFENYNIRLTQKIILWFVILLSLFLTKSTGGLYGLLVYMFLKIILVLSKRINLKKLIVSYWVLLSLLLVIVIDIYSSNILMNSIFGSLAFQRWSSNSLSGRFDIYLAVLKEIPPIIGNGYTMIRNGIYVTPHSDHLRFLYSYGILSYICLFIMVLNRKLFSRYYLFFIPAIIAFSINSLIDEPRLLYTFAILAAIANTQNNSLLRKIS